MRMTAPLGITTGPLLSGEPREIPRVKRPECLEVAYRPSTGPRRAGPALSSGAFLYRRTPEKGLRISFRNSLGTAMLFHITDCGPEPGVGG